MRFLIHIIITRAVSTVGTVYIYLYLISIYLFIGRKDVCPFLWLEFLCKFGIFLFCLWKSKHWSVVFHTLTSHWALFASIYSFMLKVKGEICYSSPFFFFSNLSISTKMMIGHQMNDFTFIFLFSEIHKHTIIYILTWKFISYAIRRTTITKTKFKFDFGSTADTIEL